MTTTDSNPLSALWREFERAPGRVSNTVKLLGQKPELWPTPHTTVWSDGKVELWRFDSDARRHATPVVVVSSLVSRSYILDLLPEKSFLAFMRDAGFDVYLLEWGGPRRLRLPSPPRGLRRRVDPRGGSTGLRGLEG